jgi:hypothetical protein
VVLAPPRRGCGMEMDSSSRSSLSMAADMAWAAVDALDEARGVTVFGECGDV